MVDNWINGRYGFQETTTVPEWMVPDGYAQDQLGALHDILEHYRDDPQKTADLSRVFEEYNRNPTSQALAFHHQMNLDQAEKDERFAHNQLTGATELWDDPTLDPLGRPQRQVQFDNGTIHTQYDPTLGGVELHKEPDTFGMDAGLPTLTREDTARNRQNTHLVLTRNAQNQLTTGIAPGAQETGVVSEKPAPKTPALQTDTK